MALKELQDLYGQAGLGQWSFYDDNGTTYLQLPAWDNGVGIVIKNPDLKGLDQSKIKNKGALNWTAGGGISHTHADETFQRALQSRFKGQKAIDRASTQIQSKIKQKEQTTAQNEMNTIIRQYEKSGGNYDFDAELLKKAGMSSNYIIRDGVYTTKAGYASTIKQKGYATDPNMVNIGTESAPMYVPKGSAAEQNNQNPTDANQPASPLLPGGASVGSYVPGQGSQQGAVGQGQYIPGQGSVAQPGTVGVGQYQPGVGSQPTQPGTVGQGQYIPGQGSIPDTSGVGVGNYVPGQGSEAPIGTPGVGQGNYIPEQGSPDAEGVYEDGTVADVADDTVADTGASVGTYEPQGDTGTSNPALDALIENNPLAQEWLKDPANQASYDSLNETLKMAWITSMNSAQKKIEAGQVINNQLDLTDPEVMKPFIQDATLQLDPYYKEQFRQYEQDLSVSLNRMSDDFQKSLNRQQDVFKRGLGVQAESEAQAGLTYGSERGRREGENILGQQQGIDDAATSLLRTKQDLAQGAERTLGSDRFGQFGGNFGVTSRSVSSGGFTPSASRTLFTPQGQLLGTMPGQKTVAINAEANRLAQRRNQQSALNSRKLLN